MRRPNILWICTDQQRFDSLGCYGNEFVNTPNIDKLAQKGTLFKHAFSQSPLCTPSRASFLTGRYPRTTRCRQNGQSIPEDEILVTRLLADAGYTCGLAGKLHISACNPSINSATERRINDGYAAFHWSHHPPEHWPTNEYTQWLRAKGKTYNTRPLDECAYVEIGPDAEDHQTTWCAEKAIQFIEANQNFEKPWLFSVNMFDPHHPFDPPESHIQRYLNKLEQIPLPSYDERELETKTSFQRNEHQKNLYPYSEMNDQDHRYIRAAYWAMIDLIDEQVGRIMESLERTGQMDQTIVIFMSDHGELLGDHGVYLKGPHFYEPSVRVPLIISYPGVIKEKRQSDQLIELVDIAPTLLEAAGLPIHPGMQGKSIWSLLTADVPEKRHREDVYCEFYNAGRKQDGIGVHATMVRTDRYKLVQYHRHPDGELYDLMNDPEERFNLWDRADKQDIKLDMMERLCDRMAGTVDPLPEREAIW